MYLLCEFVAHVIVLCFFVHACDEDYPALHGYARGICAQ